MILISLFMKNKRKLCHNRGFLQDIVKNPAKGIDKFSSLWYNVLAVRNSTGFEREAEK